MCDKENKVKLLSDGGTVTSLSLGEVVLKAKRCKSMYMADLRSILGDELTCLRA